MLAYFLIFAAVVLLACWCVLTRTSRQLRRELQHETERIEAQVGNLKAEIGLPAEKGNGRARLPVVQIAGTNSSRFTIGSHGSNGDGAELSPEAREAVQSTLSALLGKEIRIRAIKPVHASESAVSWVTQGRVAVQGSHNDSARRG